VSIATDLDFGGDAQYDVHLECPKKINNCGL